MDLLEKAYYEAQFENAFLKARGNEFQSFFNELMGRAYKSDYMPCRPWGNRGDRKNDGFLKSDRRLFQVYAPNEMTEKEAIAKIDEDFEGAKNFWGRLFDKWAFVHNAYGGIPPHVQRKILDLEAANPGFKLEPWGLEELRTVFRKLERQDIESWLGYAPNSQTKVKMGFEDLRVVLETIGSKKPDSTLPVKQVPPKKIEANQLSDAIATLLKEGMTKASLVDDFFRKWHDPAFGERIAMAFREQYRILRETRTPNEIFFEFQTWVGGSVRGIAEHEMAVLTAIAYYFESCDIFEEPNI
ncbi:MAG: hypothetical protein NTX50_14390 [Candidatus Sumerlaeota bacterium]|nr:hypothetical protein [Candidatus Sumerlaeota bacterium]